MCPLMQAYREIRRYGVIEHDADYNTRLGWKRYMDIKFEGKVYSVVMLNGEVLKIEVVG